MDKNILILGETNSGKTSLLQKKYKNLIEKNKVSSEKVLVLVQNRQKAMQWKENITFETSSKIMIGSFFGFMQRELKTHWALVLKRCNIIEKKKIFPVFMTFEASQSLMNKTIEYYRKKGYLRGLISTKDRIARKFLSNISNASLAEIPLHEIGERLYQATYDYNNNSKYIYDDLNTIIEQYMKRSLKTGTLDYSLVVYVYSKYLLSDKKYINNLKKRLDYLLVDDIETIFPVQIDFINKLKGDLNKTVLAYNTDGGFGIPSSEKKYLKKEILDNPEYKKIELQNTEISQEISKFSHEIYKSIIYNEKINSLPIHLDTDNELKNIMNKKVISKVLELLEEGAKPEEIAIIIPSNDLSLEYELKNILDQKKIKLLNLNRKDKITDYPFNYALVTFAYLIYDFNNILLNQDDIRTFLKTILEIDYIRASLLVRNGMTEIEEKIRLVKIDSDAIQKRVGEDVIKKYDYIRNWIKKHKQIDIDIPELFKKIYLEFFMKKDQNREDIINCRSLIDTADNFIKVIKEFDMIKNPNIEFLKFIKEESISSETIFEFQDRLNGDYITLTTPSGFFLANKNCKYQIWNDINNSQWMIKYNSELNNPFVLGKSWDKNQKYTKDIEQLNDRMSLATMIKRLTKKSKKIYSFGCNYSLNGREHEWQLININNNY